MKKLLLLLLLSGFAFGQNIPMLQKMQNSDKDLIKYVSNILIPNYKAVKGSKFETLDGMMYEYYYLPNDTSAEKIEEFKNNGMNDDAVNLSFIVNGDNYTFVKVAGKCSILMPFWRKEIQSDLQIKKGVREDFNFNYADGAIRYLLHSSDVNYYYCYIDNLNSFTH